MLRRVGGDRSVQIERRHRRRGRRGWIKGDGSGALRLDLVHADDVDEVGWRLDLRGRWGLLAPGEEEAEDARSGEEGSKRRTAGPLREAAPTMAGSSGVEVVPGLGEDGRDAGG